MHTSASAYSLRSQVPEGTPAAAGERIARCYTPSIRRLMAMNRGGQPGVFSFQRTAYARLLGAGGKQLAFPHNSIHTLFTSNMPFAKIIFVVFSNG